MLNFLKLYLSGPSSWLRRHVGAFDCVGTKTSAGRATTENVNSTASSEVFARETTTSHELAAHLTNFLYEDKM